MSHHNLIDPLFSIEKNRCLYHIWFSSRYSTTISPKSFSKCIEFLSILCKFSPWFSIQMTPFFKLTPFHCSYTFLTAHFCKTLDTTGSIFVSPAGPTASTPTILWSSYSPPPSLWGENLPENDSSAPLILTLAHYQPNLQTSSLQMTLVTVKRVSQKWGGGAQDMENVSFLWLWQVNLRAPVTNGCPSYRHILLFLFYLLYTYPQSDPLTFETERIKSSQY